MEITGIQIRQPHWCPDQGCHEAVVAMRYQDGPKGERGEINLMCRSLIHQASAPDVIANSLAQKAIAQLEKLPNLANDRTPVRYRCPPEALLAV